MEYTFEIEIEIRGELGISPNKVYYCDGDIEFEIHDGAVGYVPYGDTQVWHPGYGDDVEITSITLNGVVEVTGYDWDDDENILKKPIVCGVRRKKWLEKIEQACKDALCEGDTLHDYARQCNEDDEGERAYFARKERQEDGL